jgi:glutamyl/glutaminyl-tRNA synthetase
MALLGWSPGAGEEGSDIFTLAQMSELFSLEKVGKTAAVYDTEKLTWMNGQYISSYELEKLTREARPFFIRRGLLPEKANENELSYLSRVIELVRERAKTLVELADLSFYFFEDDFSYDQKTMEKVFKKEGSLSIVTDLVGLLSDLNPFDRFSTESLFNDYCASNDLSTGKVIQPARLAVTGLGGGPGLFEIMELIGQERTIKRLSRAVATIPDQLP